ncbi:MAG: 3,4-dihydroxy-2-butanone-4-phosphate synthase [Flavobacteriales bacterium]
MKHTQLNKIDDAIEDIKNGKIVIVVDDENRENEGDFIAAAEKVTPEMINFMATHGRGLICTPLTEKRCEELNLHMMVENNTVLHHTQFTVSVDLIGHGCTTGISAHDRAKTIEFLAKEETQPHELGRPGHIFPLKAKNGGVLRRAGHTEAAVDLARLAGLKPAGILVEILNQDGSMARLPQLIEVAKKFNLKIISIEDLVAYRMQKDSLVEKIEEFPVKTTFGDFTLTTFKQTNNDQIHFALTKGEWNETEAIPVRVKASSNYYDLFASLTKGEDHNISKTTQIINKEGKGAFIIINNVANPELILNKLQQFKQFQLGNNLSPTLPMDQKDYGIGAQIIKQLGIYNIRLISNKTKVLKAIEGYGIHIVDHIGF